MSSIAEMSPLSRGVLSVGLAGSLLLSGCSTPENTEPSPAGVEVTHDVADDAVATVAERYSDITPGGCSRFSYTSGVEQIAFDAKNCAEALVGRLVIVDFTDTIVKADRMADALERLLPLFTGGVVKPTIDVVQASPRADVQFAQSLADGCDQREPTEFAAFAAIDTMTELAPYDAVIALHDEQLCIPEAAGIADTVTGRLADIESQYSDGTGYTEQQLNYIAAHEILHLYGLGHAGRVQGSLRPGENSTDLTGNHITVQSGALDLISYVQSADLLFEEYGDITSIMSSESSVNPESLGLSPIHQAVLNESAETVNNTELSTRNATNEPMVVDVADALNGAVAMVDFELDVEIAVGTSEDRISHHYPKLAIVPMLEGSNGIQAVELALVDRYNNYVTLGSLENVDGQGGVFIIGTNDGAVTLTFDASSRLTVTNAAE